MKSLALIIALLAASTSGSDGDRSGPALLASAAVTPAAGAGSGREAPSLARPETGPIAVAAPTDAVVAEDAASLARLLAEPSGPSKIALRPIVYSGDLVVRRPVELLGTTGAVLEGSGTRTVITISADDVTVSDVTVRRSGQRQTAEDAAIRATGHHIVLRRLRTRETLFGITLEQCKRCVVDRVHVTGLDDPSALRGDGIKLWESDDTVVRDSVVEDSRDVVVWYTRRAHLLGTHVYRSRYGAHFMYAHDSVVRGVRVVDSVVGIFVMYSARVHAEGNVLAGARGPAGMGIGFKDSDDVELVGNWLVANTLGTYLDSTPRTPTATVVFRDNVVALNEVGVRLHSSLRGVSFRDNDFRQNATTADVEGGGDARDVEFLGNHFSAYEGYDLDHDGVGDVAYEEKILSSSLTGSRPALKLFEGTLAMGLVDAAARAVPVLASRTLFTDPRPRMAPLGEDSP